jgi:hypothetical protein
MSRKLLLSLASLALLGLAAAPRAATAQTLLSQGKTATASSVENAGTPASAAVDGNTGTRWSSAFSDPQWIQVDLGATATISQVVLQWEAAYGKAYQIQTSNDAATWTTIYSTTTGAGGTETLTVSGSGRYVRMYGTARGTGYGYSLWEFQVFGAIGSTDVLLSQGQPATASSTENAGTPASAAVDGNTGTRWSSAFSDPQWLQVDLGSTATIHKVVLQWEAAYGKAYQIQTSNDAATWTSIYSTTTGAGGTETLTVNGSGRYVRMYGTARGTAYGYSLWEFQVFGVGGGGGNTCTTLAGAPTGLAASNVGNTGFTLGWTAPAAGANCTITGYKVYQNGTALATTYTTTSAAISGLTAATTYSYQVSAVNQAGEGPKSATLSVTTTGAATCATKPAAPGGLAASNVTSNSVTLGWTAPAAIANCTLSGYKVYTNGANPASTTATSASLGGLAASTSYTFTVTASNQAGEGPAASVTVSTNGSASNPNFGSNVVVFDTTMSAATIQSQINAIYATQQNNQFGTPRNAILFKPGTYAVDIPVGFYTQVAGLGALPTQVSVSTVHSDAYMANGNATQNFWRGLENFTITSAPGAGVQWAVSQACPFRRMNVANNNLLLYQPSGSQNWASGGWMSDSMVKYDVTSGSQQQWISRNSQWGSWTGSVWNMVFVGIPSNLPGGTWPTTANTFVNPTPVVAEKPFLWLNGANYEVYVPAVRTNLNGVTWTSTTQTQGTSISLDQFYVAHAGDSAATINAQLAAGKHLLLTPGVYDLTAPISVTSANTVVMGMGFATLHPTAGTAALTIADVDGVRISHLLVDAGATNSPVLVQVGPPGSSASHAANPTMIQDVFGRIGGAGNGAATVAMQVNSNNVVIDHIWMWRADHGAGAGWTTNPSLNGFVVNGQNVTAYGLFVEHFQQYQVLWNGNGGRTYFYQSEIPYDPPDQASWSAPGEQGWPSYKVASGVTSHQAYGLGIYSVFTNANIYLSNAIEVPSSLAAGSMQHMITVNLTANGGINNVINNTGGATPPGIAVGTPKVTSYP